MTVKLVLLKSGEDLIADVTEMYVGDGEEARVLGYYLDKACTVKIVNSQNVEDGQKAFNVSLFPWMPLSADEKIPIPSDWVVTIVEPKEKLLTMYLEDVLGNGQADSETDSAGEPAEADQ